MLKQLNITNIILIESAEIEFTAGFNVLSGETGSGKSAIMHAIGLIAGERLDIGMIRKGAEKGIVEAVFDIQGIAAIESLLEQGGIDFQKGEELYIRREFSILGKSRAYINNQLAQISLLRSICGYLINIVSQHANQYLFSLERHREILDLFGDIKEQVLAFSLGWKEENALENKLELFSKEEGQRIRQEEICQMILKEIEEANLKEGEEEELFQEYTLLTHTEEIRSKVRETYLMFSGEKSAVLSHLHRYKSVLSSLAQLDSSLKDLSISFQNAVLELQEVANTLNIYQSRLESHPERIDEVNDRLTLITRLKKKYGSTVSEIKDFAQKTRQQLHELQNADHQIEELQNQLHQIKIKNNQRAVSITEKRQAAALKLSTALKKELLSLNMPKVDFQIDVTLQKRGPDGDNRVEFFLIPNIGEDRISIKDCASGGELSRVMLSIQTVLSGKERVPTLVFDEIDANIGGETAKIVGEKLKTIGKKQQVLCITHFPQVAKQADHHIQITKKVIGDRTLTFVNPLDDETRANELMRMSGN